VCVRPSTGRGEPEKTASSARALPTDVQAALTVLGTRNTKHDGGAAILNLNHARLRGAQLGYLRLTGADLTGAVLTGASLNATRLAGANHATHFTQVDVRDLRESFLAAGLKQFTVQTEPGSEQFSEAKKDIQHNASVLIVDARYSGLGTQIEMYAKRHCVPVIDYDYLTVGGTHQYRHYYVGYDSLKIGLLMGEGLVNCVSNWHVKHPRLLVMNGGSTDYNSALYAQGYDAILARQYRIGWKDVSNPAGTWDAKLALNEFQQQYAAHKNVNAALIPNDENGAPIIAYLKGRGVKADEFPVTGLDATVPGLQNILTGYQCGTVYKPIYLEAQAAAALAMYIRAGVRPPAGLLNGTITDPQTKASVASVLLTPVWVTTANMNSTVVADKFVPTAKLCAGKFAPHCAKAKIPVPRSAAGGEQEPGDRGTR
jgi:D-xylose transport system substrate-binding protein